MDVGVAVGRTGVNVAVGGMDVSVPVSRTGVDVAVGGTEVGVAHETNVPVNSTTNAINTKCFIVILLLWWT